jgi:hypothetical protein
MTSLLEVLKEQSSFGFTGKVNLLLASNGQLYGVIYLHEGFMVGSSCGQMIGRKSLFKLVFEDVESQTLFKFIVEPELVAASLFTMKLSYDEVKSEAQKIYQKYVSAKKLKPSMGLRLVVDPEILVNSEPITPDEFDILSVLAEWCVVSDIYKYSKLMEFEVTNALVSLRKKRAIKVFQN